MDILNIRPDLNKREQRILDAVRDEYGKRARLLGRAANGNLHFKLIQPTAWEQYTYDETIFQQATGRTPDLLVFNVNQERPAP